MKNPIFLTKYAIKHKKRFGHIEKKQYLCSGFENDNYSLQNEGSHPRVLRNKTNLFCTLNKQTNTLEKQAS